ncbi:2Fe-2S ferredoxin-type domain-containing protein [Pseudomassariella vexata]|uniref:2Fe-2S ferredoxin-type domain-containing protein n=1 Tax=Pseudomassariella vexata TaxID=1141098 RepID=A0A1Y2EIU6_9PEZI|nr:2Fe-2S ferredoxin-type domain-containing protein [Pseudomassariella vexata]ORY71480.1 2Fe-2S ferredoxin-type domain-containing protein [Pseudomassariella vexata]
MAATPRSLSRSLQKLASTPRSSLLTQFSNAYRTISTQSQAVRSIPLGPRIFASPRRTFTSTPTRSHGHITPPKPGEELWVTFIDKENREHKIAVAKGDNLLDVAQAHDLEMEGACGGSCACSTCHIVVLEEDMYEKMSEPEDDENDMLDLAFGLTETSRLGCQVHMTKELDGLRVKLPSMTRNLQASDFGSK